MGELEEALRAAEGAAGSAAGGAAEDGLARLRRLVMLRGLGPPTAAQKPQGDRVRAWKALLGVRGVDAARYRELVGRGPHGRLGDKIRNDTFRTFRGSATFAKRVPEARLVRVLNAFVHAQEAAGFTYVQGMNAVCGMLLFVMPELDAFHCLEALACHHMPAYVGPNLAGVTAGCQLLEDCLERLDPELAAFMRTRLDAQARIYAFAPLLTLSACCPPVEGVVQLWDVLFAIGVHLNVALYAARLIMLRGAIMGQTGGTGGTKSLDVKQCLRGRDFPAMNAPQLLAVGLPLLLRLDEPLMERLASHTIA